MSDISKLIDQTIREGIAPLLKEEGFKKKARTFHRAFDDRIEVVNVQASKLNEGSKGSVTINLGVYFPIIAELSEAIQFKGLPKEYDCTVRKRIGHLFPSGCDHWWDIEGVFNKSIAEEQRDAVLKYGLPWIEKMATFEEAKIELRDHNMAFVAACISFHQGNLPEASSLLALALKQQPRAAPRINAWSEKHKINEAEQGGAGQRR